MRKFSKQVLQENKAYRIFRKAKISYPLIRTCTSFGKFGVLCFLVTPVLRFDLFALLPTNCKFLSNVKQGYQLPFISKILFPGIIPLGVVYEIQCGLCNEPYYGKSLKTIECKIWATYRSGISPPSH